MNHLIIYAHPNAQSFNHAILESIIAASKGHEVHVRNLFELNFNPILDWQEAAETFSGKLAADVAIEQSFWKQADLITLIYPLWWMGFPAILKGYLDRVLTYGFAYENGKNETIGLLKGKRIQQFVTMGNSNQKYAEKGFLQSLDHTLGNGLFNFCGMEVDMHFLGAVGLKTTDYEALLNQVKKACLTNLK